MARLGVSSACRFQFMETVRSKLGLLRQLAKLAEIPDEQLQ
jgi:hypothetical protein